MFTPVLVALAAALLIVPPAVHAQSVPAAPTGLTATPGDSQVTLDWDNPNNSSISGYQVSMDGGDYDTISGSDASTTSHTETGLINGTSFTFAVRAVNVSGTGDPATVTATPLFAAPKNLGVTVGDGQVELSWDDPLNNNISGYQVSIDAGRNYDTISGSGASTIFHTVTGLTNGMSYTFAVRAVNGAAAFVWATPTVTSVAVPAAPSNLQASAGGGQVTLNWDDPNNSSISGYHYSRNGGTSYRLMYLSGATTTSHTDVNLTGGIEYSFVVRAVNEAGTGAVSAAVNATPLFKAPRNLGATVGDGQVMLRWDDPDNDNISRYQVSIDGGTNYSAISSSGASTINHMETGLTNGTSYTFAVRAVNSPVIGVAAMVSATPRVTNVAVPDAPTNLTAEAGNMQAELIWDDPGNSSISGYQVSIDGGTTYSDISSNDIRSVGNTISHTVTGLTNWTTYNFALRAVNEGGTGAPATASAHPGVLPTAPPSSISANPLHERVELSWTAPTDDTPITGYKLAKKESGGSDWRDFGHALGLSHTAIRLNNLRFCNLA